MTRKLVLSKGVRILLIGLLLGAAGVANVFAVDVYPIQYQNSQGTYTLYFRIRSGGAVVSYPNIVQTGNQPEIIKPWEDYTKPVGQITIPSMVNLNNQDYNVTEIDRYAFFECTDITGGLVIPNTVTKIGDHAFMGCANLTGDLVIPNTVSSIGGYAFSGCKGFNGSLTLPNNQALTIGGQAFEGCSGFTGTLEIPAGTNPFTASTWNVFVNCAGFTNLVLFHDSDNNGVDDDLTLQYLGCGTFYGCSGLSCELKVPTSVIQIGESTFRNDSLLLGTPYIPADIETIPNYVYSHCKALTGTVVIPSTVTTIGTEAFRKCEGVNFRHENQDNTLFIRNTVTSIGNHAFRMCNFTTLTFETGNDNVSLTIGESAFQDCLNVSGPLIIPKRVSSIGRAAFYGDKNLTSVSFNPESPLTKIENQTFSNCTGLANNPLVFPPNLTSIGNNAFEKCTSLKGGLVIPENVTSLGNWAFNGDTGLDGELVLNNNLVTIGEGVFSGCNSLIGSLIIPESVTEIKQRAFYGCKKISGDIIVGSNVTAIGYRAFRECNIQGNIVLKRQQDFTIGEEAFYQVSNFSALYCYAFNPPTMGKNAFDKKLNPNIVFVPFCSLEAYEQQAVDENTIWDTWIDDVIDPETQQVITPGHYDTENGKPWNWRRFVGQYCNSLPCEITHKDGAWVGTPTSTTKVTVEDNFELTGDLTVAAMGILEGNTLTIDGGSLTVANDLVTFADSYPYPTINGEIWHSVYGNTTPKTPALVKIKNDGQLYNSSSNVNGEYDKTIEEKLEAGADNYATAGWYTVASPVDAEITPSTDNGFNASGYNLYYYDEDAAYSEWKNYKQNGFPIVNGMGYLYGNGNAATVLTMDGYLHKSNDPISIELSYASTVPGLTTYGSDPSEFPIRGFNLVGNPFPHQMELSDVKIGANEYSAEAITGYYVADGGGNLVASTDAIKTGQGFFMQASATGQSVFMSTPTSGSNGGRSVDNSYVRIEMSQDDRLVDRAYVKLNEGGEGLTKFGLDLQHTSLCIPQGNMSFAIVVKTEEQNVMPLNYSAQADGTYTLTVALENADLDYLHLIDNMTGADVDLLLTPTYTFDSRTSDYATRFKILFDGDTQGQSGDDFAYFVDGNLVINSVEGVQNLYMFDMSGRVVLNERVSGSYNRQLNLTPGVYVVNLNGRNQKLVVR